MEESPLLLDKDAGATENAMDVDENAGTEHAPGIEAQEETDPVLLEQQAVRAARLAERNALVTRLVGHYRQEATRVAKLVLKKQNAWYRDLQQGRQPKAAIKLAEPPAVKASAKMAATPPATAPAAPPPYVKPQPQEIVRKRLAWKAPEREALKRHVMAFGVNRWNEIHAGMQASVKGFRHGVLDVEDAVWQMLMEVLVHTSAQADRDFLRQLLVPVQPRLPITTPGAPFSKLGEAVVAITRRARILSALSAVAAELWPEDVTDTPRLHALLGSDQGSAERSTGRAAGGAVVVGEAQGAGAADGGREDGHAATAAAAAAARPAGGPADSTPANTTAAGTAELAAADSDAERITAGAETSSGAIPGPPPPAPGWGVDADVALLLGVWRYGLGAYEAMRADPELGPSFDRAMQAAVKAEPLSGDAAATDEAAAPHAAAPGSDGTPAHASWPAPDALMRRLVQLVAHLSRALTKAVRQQCTTAAPSAAGDSAGADAGAVAGAVAGAGAGAVAGPAAGAGGARAAPHADVLAGWESWDDYQMGHVADDQAGGSSAKPAAGKRMKKENGSAAKASVQQPWSKRERLELVRTLMAWGLPMVDDQPWAGSGTSMSTAKTEGADGEGSGGGGSGHPVPDDWEVLRAHAAPQIAAKSDEELAAAYQSLLEEMDEFLDITGQPRVKRGNQHQESCECAICQNQKRAEARRRGEEGADAAGANPAPSPVPGPSPGEPAAAAADAAGGTGGKAPKRKRGEVTQVLTPITAQRLWERLDMLDTFQRGLVSRQMGWEHDRTLAVKNLRDEPTWWGPEADVALVEGMLKHGFGNWQAVFEDPELPLLKASQQGMAELQALQQPEQQQQQQQQQQGANGHLPAAQRTDVQVDGYSAAGQQAAAAAGVEAGTGEASPAIEAPDSKQAPPQLPLAWTPDPKMLTKRCKKMATAIKRMLHKPPALPAKARGLHTFESPSGHPPASRELQDEFSPPPKVSAAAMALAMEIAAEAAAASRGGRQQQQQQQQADSASMPGSASMPSSAAQADTATQLAPRAEAMSLARQIAAEAAAAEAAAGAAEGARREASTRKRIAPAEAAAQRAMAAKRSRGMEWGGPGAAGAAEGHEGDGDDAEDEEALAGGQEDYGGHAGAGGGGMHAKRVRALRAAAASIVRDADGKVVLPLAAQGGKLTLHALGRWVARCSA